jgi:hypothetical protein
MKDNIVAYKFFDDATKLRYLETGVKIEVTFVKICGPVRVEAIKN